MPKILITGNGFDLSLGLPTSYSDFITILNSVENNDISFESIYSKSSTSIHIKNNCDHFSIDNIKTELLKTKIESNIWYHFFKHEYEIETWIDFENKIEYVLSILFSAIEYIQNKIFEKGSIQKNNLIYDYGLFNNNIEIIQVLKNFNIIITGESNYIHLNKEYLIEKYGYYIKIDLNKITLNLYQELLNFKTIFNYYFELFVFPLYDKLKIKVDRSIYQTITKHYTFNFTPTFEKLFKKVNITDFLHGKIDSNSNQIVLGINEVPSDTINRRFFLQFTKYFQKLNNGTDYIFLRKFESKKNDNYIFFFVGHSLDKSDQDYIIEVFDFVKSLKSKIRKIIVIYHNEESKSKLLLNLLDIRGKDDIIELMRSDVLYFMKIDSKEFIHELKRDISISHSRIIT